MPKKYNILVLGGCGFIGSHMSEFLVNKGHKIRIFDRKNASHANIKNILNKVELIKGDFQEKRCYKKILKNIDIVYHLIGNTLPTPDSSFEIEYNEDILPTVNFLEELKDHSIKKIIYSSSGGAIYGNVTKKQLIQEDAPLNPVSNYGLTKVIIEKYIHMICSQSQIPYSIARISNCYGEGADLTRGQGAVSIFIKNCIEGKKITIWGDGSNVRDYIYFTDVIKGLYLLCINSKSHNKIYNFGTENGTSTNELIHLIEKLMKRKIQKQYTKPRPTDVLWNVLNSFKAGKDLGWKQEINLSDGIKKILIYNEFKK